MFSYPTSGQPATQTVKATRTRIATMAAVLAVTGAASIALAGPAAAANYCPSGTFCAFDDINRNGTVLLISRAPKGSNRVDVADDRVSSASNFTSNRWEGVTTRTRLPDQVVFRFGPNSIVDWVGGGANDKIDHFNVR